MFTRTLFLIRCSHSACYSRLSANEWFRREPRAEYTRMAPQSLRTSRSRPFLDRHGAVKRRTGGSGRSGCCAPRVIIGYASLFLVQDLGAALGDVPADTRSASMVFFFIILALTAVVYSG